MYGMKRVWMSVLLAVLFVALSSVLVSAQSDIHLPVISNTQDVEAEPEENVPPIPPANIEDDDEIDTDEVEYVDVPALPDATTSAEDFVAYEPAEAAAPAVPEAYDRNRWRVRYKIGIGTDVPRSRLDIRYGGTGSVIGGTPLGNGPGWIFYAANGHRRDLTAWNGGFYFGASPGGGAASPSQLVLRENGRVGIGTFNPKGKLDVDFGATGHVMAGTPLGNGPGWIFYAANGNRRDITAWNGGLYFGARNTSGAAPSNQLVLRENGRVGIGTFNPQGKLDVDFGSTGHVMAGTPLGNGPGWIFYAANGHRRDLTAWNGGFYFGASSTGGAASSSQLVLRENGRVGIGTTNPADKLEVKNGNIRVTNGSFIDDGTSLNVPDYVFEPDYSLMPLDELRAFTVRERHLPNVPSMEDVQANGLNISQFNMQLLEKVEELTLYTFQQQEQIEALEARVQEMEALQ